MLPQFSPLEGIGSTYKDPRTGEMYRYTKQGWVKDSEDIKIDTEEEGTFEVKPDEKELVVKLKAGGSDQAQINRALSERRTVLSNVGEEQVKPEADTTNPFGDMSKREMLRDAFNKGVTDPGELKDLGDLYDTLVGDEGTDVEIAEQFIADNPEASQEELFVALKENTELDVSTINALLKAAGTVSTEDLEELSEDDMRKIAITAVKDATGLFKDPQKGKEQAKEEVDAQPDLTRQQKTQIKQIIDEEFPKGRTIFNKILPFGK